MLENDDKPIKYKKLWDWLLCVKVFEDLYSDSSATIKTQENINKVIDDFFKNAVKLINMFINMKLSSKIKFLFEEAIIILILVKIRCGKDNHSLSNLNTFETLSAMRTAR